ncbi:hypothetical protein TRFO_21481 [Tritrichomonas foetus]|uniref:Cache domain-containing protein n=1 Tax=Tritrichomonas foetus TaxID=1144522 RepID=A0A1J4KDT4_9EUKA|nr:hypothetical protein TRFO_21481 [Tritrichomonas foetus]|eukprot:OHT09593.1 hypothetical protein TRFO_21481 [Tritrichomonas foetus]
MQTSIFSRFTAKRGAGRIERYFVKLRNQQINFMIILTSFVLNVILIVLYNYLHVLLFQNFITETVNDMMESTRAHNYYSTVNIFFEAFYFSSVFSDFFSYPSIFYPVDEKNAEMITKLSYFEHKIFQSVNIHSCFVHDFGFISGSVVSVETQNYNINDVLLWYANVSSGTQGYLCSWAADENGLNESFPIKGGICLTEPFTTRTRMWFQYADSLNRSTWTPIYYGIFYNSITIPVISASVPVYSKNGVFQAIASSDMNLENIRQIFTSLLPGGNSRYALISENGVILTATGSESPIDFYKGDIVTKTLWELRDPVWKAITDEMDSKNMVNKTVKIEIDDQILDYSITIHTIIPAKHHEWQFISAACISEIYPVEKFNYEGSYISSMITLVAGWFLFFVFSFVFEYLIGIEQNRLLSSKYGKPSKHLRIIGIELGLSSLKRLIRSHADNPDILTRIRNVILDLQLEHDNIFFSRNKFYSGIYNSKVRSKFEQLYGANDEMKDTLGSLSSLNDNPILYPKKIAPHPSNESISSIKSSSMKSVSIKSVDAKSNSSKTASFKSFGIALSSVLHQSFIRRKGTLTNNREQSIEYIKSLLQKYNSAQPLFDFDDFDSIIEELLNSIDDSLISLCADSLEFVIIMLQWKFQDMIIHSDYAFALLISCFIWQLAMHKRNKENKPLIRRYFVEQKKIMETTNMVLTALYQACLNDDENLVNGNGNERWEKFVEIILKIIYVSSIDKHLEVILKVKILNKTMKINKQTLQRNSKETIDIMRLLYIASNLSFYFHGQVSIRNVRYIINTDFSSNEDKITSFLFCMKNEYLKHLSTCLNTICEKKFMKKFHEELS